MIEATSATPAVPRGLTRGPQELSAWSRLLRESVRQEAAPFRRRALLVAESFRRTEAEPSREIRWAAATAHVLAACPIRIRRGERLVGWHPSSHPSAEEEPAIRRAHEYLHGQEVYVAASEGHMALDNPRILAVGLDGLLAELRGRRGAVDPADPSRPDKRVFYDAAETSLTALQGFIERYARLAGELAATEADPAWRAELEAIAGVCGQIAHAPARTFRQAVQLVWFCFLGVCMEAGESHHCFGPGRIDQYLLPFLQADRDAAALDDALVDDLLDQVLIKCNEFAGREMSAVIVGVGGRRGDGADATNELSCRLLRSSCRVRMYFPGIDIAWHGDMPEDFVLQACELLRNGNGQPSFFNDRLIIEGLQRYGLPWEHAVDHLPSTCTEMSIQGRCNPWVAWPYVNIPMALLGALFGGRRPDTGEPNGPATPLPRTCEDLLEAFDTHLAHAASEAVARGVADQALASRCRPFPLLSCFIEGCLESGRNISHGGATYNFLQPEAVGISNVVDSLAAIRTLVDRQGRFTLDDFRAAVAADWAGWEALHRAVLRDCPKYGNDDAWVSDLFAHVAGRWCDHIEGARNHYGGPVFPGFLGWVVWRSFGEETPATPDGRKARDPLANSIAPCSGVRVKGIPSALRSAAGWDHARGLGGVTFNLRFNGNSLAAPDGPGKLKAIIEVALESLGIYMLQVEVTSTETMRAAQERPEEYADLLVRIGGYLVPFTLLDAKAQEEVIQRAEFAP